ncbi:ADP-ribosylglycohydrolase family protein [Pseudomonas sp. F1002]|nr:ADP-ribosylglycohydrolase family protein [Pseudomonas sp. G1002]NWB61983.1 ADP-ribosylglycohydrolase family protein [Pseudomonas sp. F1002]NWC06869.1 ADP-ribosylglycohydrolase family protein [Pseudomonas sp. G1002]
MERRERAVVNSALWAAAGDALGWMTELARGEAGVKHRVGKTRVTEPVKWQRMIGGRNGPKVALPAGTYSDDTQLRLAVSRSIRGNGSFDVETFAKIEVTVWPTYALGGGLGTKAAAVNLSRRGVNWFSNFYERGTQKYITGGGNGAAMRVQPHVWASKGSLDDLLLNVLRDSLVTHGHPHGFCGAVFHALTLNDVLKNGEIPGPGVWQRYIDRFTDLPALIGRDSQLAAFWRSAWESNTGGTLEEALIRVKEEALRDVELISELILIEGLNGYHQILEKLGCLTVKYRGSGFKTALAASVLAYVYRKGPIEEALIASANELESDTDTIATMAGALLGAIALESPMWPVQDAEYITKEAKRLASISQGRQESSFVYPDLGRWNPPSSQAASIGISEGGLAIAGLGILAVEGIEYQVGDAIWQWCRLPFGQTILAKRRAELKSEITKAQLPEIRRVPRGSENIQTQKTDSSSMPQTELTFETPDISTDIALDSVSKVQKDTSYSPRDKLDVLTDEVIFSNFDDQVFGRMLNEYIDSSQSVESAVAFVSIVAKAKLVRQRRRR